VISEQNAKNFENKLEHTKKDLESLKITNSDYEQQISTLKSKFNYEINENERLSSELKMATDKLSTILKAKNAADALNEDLKNDLEKFKGNLNSKDELVISQRMELENKKSSIIELERELDTEETKRKNIQNDFDIHKKCTAEKIRVLEDRIKSEIEAKENIIKRCTDEENMHSKTKANLLKAASDLEDIKLKLSNQENTLRIKEKTLNTVIDDKLKLQSQLAKIEVEKDAIKLEKEKAEEVCKKIEEFYKEKLAAKKKKKSEHKEKNHILEEQNCLIYEDLYTKCVDLSEKLQYYTENVFFYHF